MCSIERYKALVGGRNLSHEDMEFCPCLQVAGKFQGESFSFWPEKNSLTKGFGLKDKHFSTEESLIAQESPFADSPSAVYLMPSLDQAFVTPIGVAKPSGAIRIGWVSFPQRCQGILGDFIEELIVWTKACCKPNVC